MNIMICPKSTCKSENPPYARFCCVCGEPLSVETTAGHRQLTVLFCDLVGSTSLSEQLDPERFLRLLRTYHNLCREIVNRYAGHVAQYLGDGVLIYFGYPNAHDDDARRAVRTALAIQSDMENLNRSFEQEVGQTVSLRMGIHTGEVIVGHEQLAVGEVPNVAARTQSLAEPNTIVLTHATHALVEPYFNFRNLGFHSLQGLRRQVQMYQVTSESEVETRMQAAAKVGITPLVGRDKEAGTLREYWQLSRGGTGQVVLVRGEPGIGKSRLVEVLKGQLEEESYSLFECYCVAYEQHTAFSPVSYLLRRTFDLQRSDSPEVGLSKLSSVLDSQGFDPKEAVPLLAPLLSITPDKGYIPLALPPPRVRQLTLEFLTNWLLRAAEATPVLLIVEDLHWMDPSSLELFNLVMSKQESSRMLMMLTYRPEFQGKWSRRKGLHEFDLKGLTEDQTVTLATHIAHNRKLPTEVLHEVVKRTDGVPLFVEELTKTILESGYLKPVNGSYALNKPLPRGAIPATVQDSLMARLDRLGNAKTLAQIGATIGRDFRHDVFQSVAELSGVEIERDMAQLINANLVTQDGVPPKATYSFKHALIQETAYRSLLKSTQQQYHQRIASVLTERFPEIADNQPELLAHHYSEAGFARQATGCWQTAGQRALERSANLEAIANFGHVLELLDNIPDKTERLQKELDCQMGLGPALMCIKGYSASEVKQSYSRATELCESLGATKQLFGALWGQWAANFVGGNLGPAREFGEQVLRLAEKRNDAALFPPARHAYGFCLCYLAQYREAVVQADAGIAYFDLDTEKINSIEFQFSSVTALYRFSGTSLLMLGFPDQARLRADKAMELTERLGHKPNFAFALTSSMWFHHIRRDTGRIFEDFKQVSGLPIEDQGYFWPVLGKIYYGGGLIQNGQFEEGVKAIQENWAAYQEMGGGILGTQISCILAEGLWKLNHLYEALDVLGRGKEKLKSSLEHHFEPELYRLTGEILRQIKGESPDKVETSFQQAIKLSQGQQAKWPELRATVSLSRLWQSQGKKEKAKRKLREIYNWFSEGFDTKDLIEARELLKELDQS